MKTLIVFGAVLCLFSTPSYAQEPRDSADTQSMQTPQFEETVEVRPTVPADINVAGHTYDYFMTFSGPVSVPGATLGAGTYLFRFPLGPGTDVIQVVSADRAQTLAMFQTIPVHDTSRTLASEGEVVLKDAHVKGAPDVMTEWYLPGQMRGYEFLAEHRAS